ncbi:MAG TPA: hypothetical protein PK048_00945 [Candidatus Absconditabacterales bacterium]|nr:hypothetical protein [Candidatus Absconditabacterales bacterium]
MKNTYVQPVIQKLKKYIGKLISDKQLESLQKDILGGGWTKQSHYKLIYFLKKKHYLVSIKKGLYMVTYPENTHIKSQSIIQEHIGSLLHTMIHQYTKKKYYIGGIVGIEIHLGMNPLPEKITIYTPTISGTHTLIDTTKVIFKPYHKLFSLLTTHCETKEFHKLLFTIGSIEQCVLESLYYLDTGNQTYTNELIKKVIKQYKKNRRWELVKQVISHGKYHTSLNRLHQLSLGIDGDFSIKCHQLINTYSFKISF